MISEPVPFLANILLVAHADGRLSNTEQALMESIVKDLRLKKSDLSAAQALVSRRAFQIKPIGTFADKVRNLEFMLQVSLADSDLSPEAAQIVANFSDAIGLTRNQLDLVHADVLSSIAQIPKLCPFCRLECAPDVNFCGKCGTPIAAQSVDLDFEVPKQCVAIEFATSTAAGFPKALDLSRASAGFQSCMRGSKAWYMATYPLDAIADAMPLVDALNGIRNKGVFIDGKPAQWNDVFGFAWCARQRVAAYRPNEYCFGKTDGSLNPWGCKQSQMDWTEWAQWFCYGHWETTGLFAKKYIWRFDKARIRHELEAALFKNRHCPYLDTRLADAVLRHFPDEVDVSNSETWGYHRSYEQVPGAIKIVEKDGNGLLQFTQEYWADGVRPLGRGILKELLAKAFKDVGGRNVSPQQLLD